jgi:hypothetical protein
MTVTIGDDDVYFVGIERSSYTSKIGGTDTYRHRSGKRDAVEQP